MPTVKILGSGCANCQRLTQLTAQALTELGIQAQVEKVTDYTEIAAYGIMSTPALVVDEQVIMAGRIPALSSLKAALAERLAAGASPFSLHTASTEPPCGAAWIGPAQPSKTRS
jgi:small redox-active disulfide protein 2